MLPLKIAILWHQHQPFYKINNKYMLPWVRLHGIKDYLDLPLMVKKFPNIKQTFNVVPSMLLQLEEYASIDVNEDVLNLTTIPAANLSDKNKQDILASFFVCNFENMIKPYPRYLELYTKAKTLDIYSFNDQEWLDIQLWYLLTWFGPISRENPIVSNLLLKGRYFSELDKIILLAHQRNLLAGIIPMMKNLMDIGQIEISVSPFYHPILPLICNSDTALEALPNNKLPLPPFKYPNDAAVQLSLALDYYHKQFGVKPSGIWPSEGSVSNEVLSIVAGLGIKWLATDEQIMMESFGNDIDRLQRFFPRRYQSSNGEIIIFFRDRLLSDLIGFSYSSIDADEAARDFINRLLYVRWEISQKFGEDSLKYAVVPIILDGENCWEFYKDNGSKFLSRFFNLLSNTPEIKTITFSEAIDESSINFFRPMNHIRAGSWINADFDIWIGQQEHIKAWDALREARLAIESSKGLVSEDAYNKAMEQIYIAEGSDWFWWYCDRHQAPNKNDFDIMFRDLLKNVYKYLNINCPVYLDFPFGKIVTGNILTNPKVKITPKMNVLDESDWIDAGIFNTKLAMDAMHSSAMSLSKVYILNDIANNFIRLEFNSKLKGEETIYIHTDESVDDPILINGQNLFHISDKDILVILNRNEALEIKFNITVKSNEGIFNYPRSGAISFKLIK